MGNRAFAAEYGRLVSHHFSVVNDQDPVARLPKGRYKRAGQRVVLNERGDIMVRPSYLEMSLLNKGERGACARAREGLCCRGAAL